MQASLVEQFAQRRAVAVGVCQVGQPVQGGLVALVGQVAQGLSVDVRTHHGGMVQPCP